MIDDIRTDIPWWPTDPKDGVAERPVAIGVYSNMLSLRQEGREILIQTAQVEEFIKALRKAAKKEPR